MNGSVLSRWSRYVRVIQPTAVILGTLLVLQSCAGKATPDNAPKPTPKPAPAPAPKPAPAPAPAPKPVPAPAPAPAPAPTPQAVQPAPKPITDSAALALQFCDRVKQAVEKNYTYETHPDRSYNFTPDSVIRKTARTIPDSLIAIALAKKASCK